MSVKGSIDFIAALKAKNVPFECHIFPEGKHGLGITKANQVEGTKQWFMLYVDWLKRLGY